MRFILRTGTDPQGKADPALLSAMGLPGGGIVTIGDSHCFVVPGDVPSPSTLLLGPRNLANTGVAPGSSVDVQRALLPDARTITLSRSDGLDSRHLARALQGLPITRGDLIPLRSAYGEDPLAADFEAEVVSVTPGEAAIVGPSTIFHEAGGAPPETVEQGRGQPPGEPVSTAQTLRVGLETQLETLTGWVSLLTSAEDLPSAWGLPKVAGVLLEGPSGGGKAELVAAAAEAASAKVVEVSLELTFKPEKLLERLERAVKTASPPAVLFVDRVDAVAGDDAMFRTQVTAILRWFLDAVAERSGLATILAISSVDKLSPAVAGSPLLPRTLSIPPPDLQRRKMLFEAALARVPHYGVDYEQLAARTAGFSGADIVAAVVHASAMIASAGGTVGQEELARAIAETNPSYGSSSLGGIPRYGFDMVANLGEVKQRLTEAVVWQMQDPERFERLGIEPPKGLLLHGPPGTGKTFVIRALAHEAGAAFFTIKGAELLDKYVGESERGVREVFARARTVAPAILFFDEIDALAPTRGNSTNSVTDSVVAALLTEMDGVSERGDVFVIGATNRKDLIDPALLRPGRLETHLYLGLPGPAARRAFLEISDVPFAQDVDLDHMIGISDGLSFAELSGLMREAALHALRRDSSAIAVSASDLALALESIQPLAGG